MPTGNKVEVTLCLADGTKLTRIEDLADITTFLEQHEEFVKIVRCKDCKHWKKLMPEDPDGDERCMLTELYDGREPNDYCSYGERRNG